MKKNLIAFGINIIVDFLIGLLIFSLKKGFQIVDTKTLYRLLSDVSLFVAALNFLFIVICLGIQFGLFMSIGYAISSLFKKNKERYADYMKRKKPISLPFIGFVICLGIAITLSIIFALL